MAASPAMTSARAAAPRAGGRWRKAGTAVAAVSWLLVVSMAARTSRFPTVLHRYSAEYAALLGLAAAAATMVTVARSPRVFAALYVRRHALLWFFVCCPLLVFVTVEGAMRAFNLLGSEFYGEIRRYMTVLARDDRLFFKNPARFRGTFQHVEIATNDLGLRERPIGPRRPGTARVLVLGDSVAFGWGVKVEDALPRQLERALSSSGREVFETVNAGVPGYNSRQELAFLKDNAESLGPDAVVLLYVDNDIDAIDPARVHMGVLPDPWKDPRGAADYFLSMSRFYFMLRHIIPFVAGPAKARVAERRGDGGWRDSMRSVEEIAAVCRARGVPLAVFHFRMLDDAVSKALNEELGARAGQDGFYFADTLSWFAGRDIRRLTNSFIDTHPNAAGHRILAEGMARYMMERGIAGGAR